MSEARMSEDERADLVAYLDGELSGEAAQAVEAKISLDPRMRAEAEALKRTWELLDYLPRPGPSPSFTERTLSRLAPARPAPRSSAVRRWVLRVALGAGWAAALLLAGWAGYAGYRALSPREPGEAELVRDLRLIENKRYYELADDVEFLKQLDHPDLFGDDPGS